MKSIFDLRSDTVTKPTEEMRKAMYNAEVGDDVYGEDLTVIKLEQMSAEIVGKEAAMFVPSGTMANQIAMMCFAERSSEVLMDANAHIFYYENGATALLTGAQVRTIKTENGILTPETLRDVVRPKDIHQPPTSLVCIENTHNRAGGRCYSLENLNDLHNFSKNSKIPLYMDGARLFNAATFLQVEAKNICKSVDALMFCLSKGLCAPVGSILAGKTVFINKARRYRKLLGGGMRQAGILAAAGIVALNQMRARLHEDHLSARKLAITLLEKGYSLKLDEIETNIVIFDVANKGYKAIEMVKRLKEAGILASEFGCTKVRFVTHNDITNDDINKICNILIKEF